MEIKATGVHPETRSRQKAVAESKKGSHPTALLSLELERATRFELATLTLAR